MSTSETGKQGEDIAADFLLKNGYEILHRNFRYSKNEVDLIVRKRNVISFVEVKARFSDKYGSPEEAVTKSKQKEIIKVAQHFISKGQYPDADYQFDVIAIRFENGKPDINFIPNAFMIF